MRGDYDARLAGPALYKRRPAPEPGTPEANPAATLIEPKAHVAGRRWFRRRSRAELADDPARWIALAPNDGRRSSRSGLGKARGGPTMVLPIPARSRAVRRAVGTADRYVGGSVRGSEWNRGWRWKLGVACAVMLGVIGVAMIVGVLGVLEFVDR